MSNRKYYTADINVMGELFECPCYHTMNSIYYQTDDVESEKEENLLNEHHLHINLNGKPYASLVCTPMQLTALVVGHLATSCIVSSLEDIEWMKYNQDNSICDVWLRKRNSVGEINEEVITSSENNQKVYDCARVKTSRKEPFFWEPKWIMELAEFFKNDTELHISTHGTHSCFLAKEGKVLYICEDIGRHNALDKAVGMGMLNGFLLSDCMIYISGRVPLDMLSKTIRTQIPLIASNTVPTRQSIELAKEKQIALIGKARPKGFTIYTNTNKEG